MGYNNIKETSCTILAFNMDFIFFEPKVTMPQNLSVYFHFFLLLKISTFGIIVYADLFSSKNQP